MNLSFNTKNSAFAVALKKKVDEYFASSKESFTGNKQLHIKAGIMLASSAAIYVLLLLNPALWLAIPLSILFGLSLAGIGFNVMHDAAHGSYSRKRWINELMAYTLNLMGGNAFLWKQKHNVNHHSFTNIEDHDDDIDIKPLMRVSPHQPHRWYHRFQHIYWVFLYGFTYVSIVFGKNFKEYFTGKIGEVKMKKMSRKEHIIFWVSKTIYIFLFLGLPLMLLGFWEVIIGYLIVSMVCGFTLGVVFQLAHVVEGTSFPVPDAGKMEQDWMRHQLATTANFSTRSKLASWLLGGLNFQVEHHLFPRISHVHYPALSLRVQEVCREFDVPYLNNGSFLRAVASHVKYLKAIGAQ
jgi:linoleoyl-CoA desaturase